MLRSKLRLKGSSVQHTLQQGVGKHAGSPLAHHHTHACLNIYLLPARCVVCVLASPARLAACRSWARAAASRAGRGTAADVEGEEQAKDIYPRRQQ